MLSNVLTDHEVQTLLRWYLNLGLYQAPNANLHRYGRMPLVHCTCPQACN